MLKHFNLQDGMPKKNKDLTVVKPVRKTSIRDWISEKDLKSSLKWPEILLTDYHDLYYNRTENSEKNDATSAKIQQMYVGSRETASTCNVLNSHQTVVHTRTKPSSAAAITNTTQNNTAMVNPATTVPESVVTKTKNPQNQKLPSNPKTVSVRRTPRKIKRPTLDPQKDPQLIFR